MSTFYYNYLDSGAPQIAHPAAAGALLPVLDACLVNGYGSKQSMGWTKPFTGTNKAVYRQPSSSNYFYMRVHDDNNNVTYGRYALVTGYETMTDVDTGTGQFPTVTQESAGGQTWWYSQNPSGVYTAGESIPWYLIGNGKLFHFIVQTCKNWKQYNHFFGDLLPYLGSDLYHTVVSGNIIGGQCRSAYLQSGIASGNYDKYLVAARGYSQTGIAVTANMLSFAPICGSGSICGTYFSRLASPNDADASYHGFPILVTEYKSTSETVLRGVIPGMYAPAHYRPMTNGDTFTDENGRNYICLRIQDNGSEGRIFYRTSDWDTAINF